MAFLVAMTVIVWRSQLSIKLCEANIWHRWELLRVVVLQAVRSSFYWSSRSNQKQSIADETRISLQSHKWHSTSSSWTMLLVFIAQSVCSEWSQAVSGERWKRDWVCAPDCLQLPSSHFAENRFFFLWSKESLVGSAFGWFINSSAIAILQRPLSTWQR